jgi:non-specific serine/threonine protein kinase
MQDALDEYRKSESVQLFTDRATTNDTDFQLTSRNGAWVAEICRRLDGMPLAIELAAARVRTLSVQQIAERLDDRFNLLTGGSRTAASRHQTLAATIEWSYALLSEKEKKLLQMFSVFSDGATLRAIESVCSGDILQTNDVLTTLSQLVDKSLVEACIHSSKKRYSLIETIQEFATGKLIESQALISTKDRHLEYFLHLAEESESKIRGPEQLSWYDRLKIEHDNLRTALSWAIERKKADSGLRLAGSLGFFWFVSGHLREGVIWLQKVLKYKQGASLASEAKALKFLGSILIFSENKNLVQISTILEKSLQLYRELNDSSGIAWVLNQLGIIAMIQGKPANARKLFEESLILRNEIGDPWDIAQTLQNFISLAKQQNDYVNAREFAERALASFQQAEDKRGIARISVGLASIAQLEGDFTGAAELLTRSLLQLVQFGDHWSSAEVLENLAFLVCERGDSIQAAILFGAAEAFREEVGMPLKGFEYENYEKDIAATRNDLGKNTFSNAWAQGHAMTLKQVAEFVSNRSGSSSPQAENGRVYELTPREREAAILVAEGKSNRDIAKEMTVTVKTVEAYVTRVLRKLGLDSRVQIAVWIIENDIN